MHGLGNSGAGRWKKGRAELAVVRGHTDCLLASLSLLLCSDRFEIGWGRDARFIGGRGGGEAARDEVDGGGRGGGHVGGRFTAVNAGERESMRTN
jgi:hypothetical protein